MSDGIVDGLVAAKSACDTEDTPSIDNAIAEIVALRERVQTLFNIEAWKRQEMAVAVANNQVTVIVDAYFAKVKLHLYDTFEPSSPFEFFGHHMRPKQYGAAFYRWVPQTLGDQVWIFIAFFDEELRDAYVELVRHALRLFAYNQIKGMDRFDIASTVSIPEDMDVKEWVS